MEDSVRRSAVVDLGSNSVRLVVFEGIARNPVPIFNEKATVRLGQGLDATGTLNDSAIAMAMEVLGRFHTIARAMRADPFDVLATAAVRDARNGPDFVAALHARMPGVTLRILNGEEEADYSACGVLCGLPEADGLVADIGGGSLELIRVAEGRYFENVTTKLGVIRLRERSGEKIDQARRIADEMLAEIPWLGDMAERPLYLVGGAFRALARLQIAQTGYPLNLVHLFSQSRQDADDMVDWIAAASRRSLEKQPGLSRKRLEDAPFAAVVLQRLMAAVKPSSVVFSAEGLREGWYMRHVASSVAQQDPMIALAEEMSRRLGRSVSLSQALVGWTAPLFAQETPHHRRLRVLACNLSDVGSYDHPEYRAEQTYQRILRSHGVGFDHLARLFIGLALAVRYKAAPDSSLVEPSQRLLSEELFDQAVRLGLALRLAYTLCAGTKTLLEQCRLVVEDELLVLTLQTQSVRVVGGAVRRRLERLAESMGLGCEIREE